MDDAHRISITICGDGGCGKSSITLRLVRSEWCEDYDPTIEDSYSVTRVIDGASYLLSLTDTAGQEEYRSLWAATNLRSDAFLLVYDITQPHSLEALEHFLQMIDMECDHRQDSGTVPPVRIVAGNKCDLWQQRSISASEGLETARARGCGFMETSAREMVNIEETFALIVRRVIAARQLHAQQMAQKSQLQKTGGRNARMTSPQSNNGTTGLFPPPSTTQRAESPHLYDKEGDTTEFGFRPGGKRVQRGGFLARFKCW